jgi:hypothetical protein
LISVNAALRRAIMLPQRPRFEKEQSLTVNVGTFDRIARVIVGLALLAFALGYLAPGTGWNWVGWIGIVPILTALFGTCPAYSLMGCSTK